MLKSKINIALLMVAAMCCSFASAQDDGVSLQWKFNAGEKLTLEIEQDIVTVGKIGGQTFETANTVNTWMDWETGEVDSDGSAKVDSYIRRMTMKMVSPMGKIEYDSDSEELDPQGELIDANIRPLIDAQVSQKMSTSGEVSEVEFPAEMSDALGAGTNSMLEGMAQNSTLKFPEAPLKVGDSWNNEFSVDDPNGNKMVLTQTYTYKGVVTVDSKTLHHFDVDVKMNYPDSDMISINEQSTVGNLYFDAELGRISHSNVEQDVKMAVKAQGQTIDQELKQIVSLKFGSK